MNAGEQQHLSRRQGYLEKWAQLQDDISLDGAERFGVFVQHVLETLYLESAWSQPGEQNLRRAFLDDLVDLFVSPRFALFKRLVMTSSSVLSETITDSAKDREGFQPVLHPGGGAFVTLR